MTLNKFSITADLEYSPESIDSFISICEGLISHITSDAGARYFLKNAVDEFTVNAIVHGYLKNPGRVILSIERLDDRIYLEIADQGIGINPSAVKLDREARTIEDLHAGGWAMSILNRISDGISIKTNQPRGAIVSLTLPLPINP